MKNNDRDWILYKRYGIIKVDIILIIVILIFAILSGQL